MSEHNGDATVEKFTAKDPIISAACNCQRCQVKWKPSSW